MSVTVISREEMRTSSGTTIDEILRMLPGIQTPLLNSNFHFAANPSISMCGLGLGDSGTRALVLVDGQPANGAFFGSVFWNRMPTQNSEPFQDTINEARLPPQPIFDASASYPVTQHRMLFLVANNIFNGQYIADGFAGLLGAPFQMFGGIRVPFPWEKRHMSCLWRD